MEIWKECKHYEDLLEVSTLGRVRRKRDGFMYKLQKRPDGYYTIDFWLAGKTKHELVHRLVALTFIKNPEGYGFVNHKDENKANNNVDNLEWCTKSYNRTYGTCSERCREHALDNPNNYTKTSQYSIDGEWLATYRSAREAARMIGFQESGAVLSKKLKEGNGECIYKGYIWKKIN